MLLRPWKKLTRCLVWEILGGLGGLGGKYTTTMTKHTTTTPVSKCVKYSHSRVRDCHCELISYTVLCRQSNCIFTMAICECVCIYVCKIEYFILSQIVQSSKRNFLILQYTIKFYNF